MNQFTGAIARFGIGRIVAILGISAGVAAALFALTMNLGEPKALLYSNLDLKEAGAITQALDQAGVKYEAKGDGSTIMVPRDQVASTRLMLSSKGLPTAGSVGYEIFDDANALGQTDMVQQMNRQRALEGELARTIGSMEGITSTRVHLALPKRQLFEEESEPPTASVSLTVGGRELDSQQVRAIQNLVAGAVPDMKPANVAVVDQHARTLSTPNDGMEAATGRKNEVEARIEGQVRKLIEGIVGPGKARVNVTADLDLSRVTVQQETFDPDGQVVRSESTTEEKAAERTSDGNGVASVAANIPPGAPSDTAGNSSNNDRTESTTNYEISKTTRTEIQEPGEVKKLAVAVAVDGVTAVGQDGKPGAFTPRSAEEIARIEQLVRTAVGYNQERGDQVTVVAAKFTPVADQGGGVTASNPLMGFDKNDIMRAAELGILAIVAVLMMIFIVRPLLRGASQGPAPMAMGGGGMAQMGPGGGGQQMMTVDPSTGQPLALMGPSEVESKIDIARIEGQVKASSVKRVSEFVEKHPEESVSILRSWVHDTA